MPYAGSSSSISTESPSTVTDGAVLGTVGTQLHGARESRVGTVPHQRGRMPVIRSTASSLARPDGDGAGDRLDVEHEARLAVRGRPTDPQPVPLADREAVGAAVADRAPRRRRSRRCRRRGWARGHRASRASQPALSPSATKQMSWLSGLSATSSPRCAASSRTAGLVESPSGNSECAQLLLVEHAEHVGLVLAVVDGPVHLDQPVVTGLAAARSGRSRPRRSRGPAPGRGRRRT